MCGFINSSHLSPSRKVKATHQKCTYATGPDQTKSNTTQPNTSQPNPVGVSHVAPGSGFHHLAALFVAPAAAEVARGLLSASKSGRVHAHLRLGRRLL